MMSRVAAIAANLPGNVVPASETCHNLQAQNATKEVGDNHPDMNEFLISQNLNRELETKGNCNQTQKCHEKSPLQASRENQAQAQSTTT